MISRYAKGRSMSVNGYERTYVFKKHTNITTVIAKKAKMKMDLLPVGNQSLAKDWCIFMQKKGIEKPNIIPVNY